MNTISLYDAKAKLSWMVSEAEQGAEFIITKHGKPVARVSPIEQRTADEPEKGFVESAKEIRDRIAARGERFTIDEIIAWKNEGRR